jgi:nucleoside-diphosphate-sugar epimerase
VPEVTSGHGPVDWVYVEDVVEAFLRAALAKNVGGQMIDIGSGKTETVRGVAQTLARWIESEHAPSFGTIPNCPLEQVRVADAHAAKDLLRWAPKVPLEESLKRTIEWYERKLILSICDQPILIT